MESVVFCGKILTHDDNGVDNRCKMVEVVVMVMMVIM